MRLGDSVLILIFTLGKWFCTPSCFRGVTRGLADSAWRVIFMELSYENKLTYNSIYIPFDRSIGSTKKSENSANKFVHAPHIAVRVIIERMIQPIRFMVLYLCPNHLQYIDHIR